MIRKLPSWFREYKIQYINAFGNCWQVEDKYYTCKQYTKQSFSLVTNCKHSWCKYCSWSHCIMLELQQSIFTILGFRCVYILVKLNSVFLLVFAVFLTLTRNRMIVYFEAKQPTRVTDKNISSSDLPSCWITGTEKQSVFWRTKQNSSQIIPLVSFIVHYEFSAQHTVWMQCEIHVQYSGIQSFHVEVKSMHAVRY